jgi:hypothetical protein
MVVGGPMKFLHQRVPGAGTSQEYITDLASHVEHRPPRDRPCGPLNGCTSARRRRGFGRPQRQYLRSAALAGKRRSRALRSRIAHAGALRRPGPGPRPAQLPTTSAAGARTTSAWFQRRLRQGLLPISRWHPSPSQHRESTILASHDGGGGQRERRRPGRTRPSAARRSSRLSTSVARHSCPHVKQTGREIRKRSFTGLSGSGRRVSNPRPSAWEAGAIDRRQWRSGDMEP